MTWTCTIAFCVGAIAGALALLLGMYLGLILEKRRKRIGEGTGR